MSPKDTSSIVTKSLTIVDILASSGRPMSYSEVLAASGFAKSSTHRLLSILQNEGVIEFDERDKSYALGKRLRAWARQSWINNDLQRQSANELEKLCESCGHNVCLMGFLEVRGKNRFDLGNFFHQLHHRHFKCNYGSAEMPWDKWFGSFHDGTSEASKRIQKRPW